MRWSRLSTTTNRGVSLLETLVACAIFGGLCTLVVLLLMQNRRANQKLEGHTDASQMALVAVEKIKREVRRGRVIGTNAANDRLSYWIARKNGVTPLLGPTGQPDWEPGFPASPAVAEIYRSGKGLWSTFQGRNQHLADLGQDGTVSFLYTPADHSLQIHLGVGVKNPADAVANSYLTTSLTLFLNTQ